MIISILFKNTSEIVLIKNDFTNEKCKMDNKSVPKDVAKIKFSQKLSDIKTLKIATVARVW